MHLKPFNMLVSLAIRDSGPPAELIGVCGGAYDLEMWGNTMVGKGTPNPIDVHVGGRVRLQRMMIGMSQEKLGKDLAITFQQVQKYEKGTNRISSSRLQQIARILSVPVSYFFEGAPGEEKRAGSDTPDTGRYVLEFLSSREGFALNRAFARISNGKVRQKLVHLVHALAAEFESAEEVHASGEVKKAVAADLSDATAPPE
jgi:transcriptional regulator with XRE-family HTH domain